MIFKGLSLKPVKIFFLEGESPNLSFTKFVLIVWQVEGHQNILKLSWRPLAFTSNKAFLKNKKWLGTCLST